MATRQKHPDRPIGVRFDVGLWRWMVKYADEHDLTVSQVVRRAVSDYRSRAAVSVGPDVVRKAGV